MSDKLPDPGAIRPRRLRRTARLRDLVAETWVHPSQLIMPHFVMPQAKGEEPIPSMPGIAQVGTETLLAQIDSDLKLGIRAVLLFGHPETGGKTPDGRRSSTCQRRRATGRRRSEATLR